MSIDCYTITLDTLPPSILSKNGRAHWRTEARVKSMFRGIGKYSMIKALGTERPAWPGARIDVTWVVKHRNSIPDEDNITTRLKPVIDGIADTGIVSDDRYIRIGTITRQVTPGCDPHAVLLIHYSDDDGIIADDLMESAAPHGQRK